VIEEVKAENSLYKAALKALQTNEMNKLTEIELHLKEQQLESMKSGSLVSTPIVEQERKIAEMNYLIENNISQGDYSTNSSLCIDDAFCL